MITNALRAFASLVGLVLSAGALVLLSSCGGGGANVNPDFGGPVQIFPQEGTFYAGMPSTITVSGSHSPYSLTSGDPGILPVPPITYVNKVQVIPNNPGVVDIGLQPGQLPIRTIRVSVRGPNATSAEATIHVAQNFLTGYTAVISSPGCAVPSGQTTVQACSGASGVIELNATFNGSLHGGQRMRFCTVVGDFQFFDIITQQFVPSDCRDPNAGIFPISDHEGKLIAPFRVFSGAPGQLAIFRVQEPVTGVYADTVFVIQPPTPASQSQLTAVPSSITFTGLNSTQCGTGSADVFIFGGRPPFTALNSDPTRITVVPSSSGANPPRFTITVTNPNPPCLNGPNEAVTFTDATGAAVTVTVTTQLGTTPAPNPITVNPGTITLACGQTGSVSVVGGSGGFFVNSTDSQVRGVVSGNTLSITRLTGDAATGINPRPSPQATISITDGGSIASVTVTSPQSCP